MTNEQRAEQIIEKYGFDFDKTPKEEIISLIQEENWISSQAEAATYKE